jgi:6-pyruvoyltetrahydropterin/6-carboxytetrahydropterin synthase
MTIVEGARCRIAVEFEWTSGHRLAGHSGRCAALHGHNYRARVTVEGPINVSSGLVMDFDDLLGCSRDWVEQNWDHCLLVGPGDELGGTVDALGLLNARAKRSVVVMDAPPSAEVIATTLATVVRGGIPAEVQLVDVTVWETAAFSASISG